MCGIRREMFLASGIDEIVLDDPEKDWDDVEGEEYTP